MRSRPRSFKAAVAAWPALLAAVEADPCDETLGQLCTLLDVMDGEIARTWKTDGHDDRLVTFRGCRAAARQANRLVTSTGAERAKAKGLAGHAARIARLEEAGAR